MYCSNCGKKNNDTSNYCYNCGIKLIKQSKNNLNVYQRQNKINFFKRIAYNIITSKRKYEKIFLLIAIAVISFAFLVELLPNFSSYVNSAINICSRNYGGQYAMELRAMCKEQWRNVWCALIFILMSLSAIIGDIIICINMLKLNRKLYKKEQ